MTFRAKMLIIFPLAVAAAVGSLTWGVLYFTRQSFAQLERQRSDAVIAQFRHEFAQRGAEVTFAVQGLADAEGTLRMAIDLNRPQADPSVYANDARGLAESRQLDFLEITGDDGVLVSSAQWPGRIGYKNDWVTSETDWNQQGAFLDRVELPDNVQLGLLAVRIVTVGTKKLYIIGGRRLDAGFLQTLALPSGMRALLYSNLEAAFVPTALASVGGPVEQSERFAPLIESWRTQVPSSQTTIQWTADPASAETFAAIPLPGRKGSLLAVLLVGSTERDLASMLTRIRNLAFAVGGGAILLEFLLAWWLSAGLTLPIERLTAGVREVAAGSWTARVDVRARGEAGRLAKEFNNMTRQLAERRELLMQTERVAAWREMAQRVSSELKEPLLQLHVSMENLARAHEQTPERFDEIFFESIRRLRGEFAGFKSTVSQFSEFGRIPPMHLQPVSVNETVRNVVKTFESKFSVIGRPPIAPDLRLDESLPTALADPDLLSKGLLNLVAHSVAAMPAGGTLTIRTAKGDGVVRIEVSDTGAALMPGVLGETGRASTQPYATRLRGTGLGLATVQSVICDQGARISLEWTPGAGNTFRIELPAAAGRAVPVPSHPGPVPGKSAPEPIAQPPSQNNAEAEAPAEKKPEPPPVEEAVEARKSDWRPFKSMFS